MSDDDAPDFPYLAIIITLKSNPDSPHFYGSPDCAIIDTRRAISTMKETEVFMILLSWVPRLYSQIFFDSCLAFFTN